MGQRGGLGGRLPLWWYCVQGSRQLGFGLFVSYYSQFAPTAACTTVIFSPLWFLCILLPRRLVQVQTLQKRDPGPRLSQYSCS